MTDAGDHVRPGRSARFVTAIATIFCANGVALANWFPRIPETRTSLALGYDELGLALFGVAAGAMLFMPATGWLVGRIGSHAVTRAAAFAICAALPLVALAPSLPLLAAALFAFGAASGTLDVAMNAQATHGERRIRRRILSRLHGLFSVGTLVGAVMGGAAASVGVPLSIHLAAVAVLLATVIAATVGSRGRGQRPSGRSSGDGPLRGAVSGPPSRQSRAPSSAPGGLRFHTMI